MAIDTGLTDGGGPQGSGGSGSSLGGIFGALALAYSAYQGSRNQDKQNQANREMADLQWQRDKEMWNMQNEYNSPKSQMGRYLDAGLNTNLIYGGGQASAGNASNAPSFHAPQQSYQNNVPQQLMQAIPMYQDFQARQAQIDNVKANTENVRTRTINEAIRESLLRLQGRSGEFKLETNQMLRPYQMQVTQNATERSTVQVKQEMERLALLKQAQQMNLLKSAQMEQGMSAQQIQMEKNQAELLFMKYRNDWMKMGVTSSDNPILRIFMRAMGTSGYGDQIENWLKN